MNSSRALYLEISQVAQYAALERAGVPVPRTLAGVGREHVLDAARRLDQSPFIVKPNRGGKGLGVQLFSSIEALAAFLDAPGDAAPDRRCVVDSGVRAAETGTATARRYGRSR